MNARDKSGIRGEERNEKGTVNKPWDMSRYGTSGKWVRSKQQYLW